MQHQSTALTRKDELAARFKQDTANHQLAIKHDDGLYRHLWCQKPGTGMYHFEIVTWPGSLAIRGDFSNDAYVFTRIEDMFAFFRSEEPGRINTYYWSEKVAGGRSSVRAYSDDVFKEKVRTTLDDLDDLDSDQQQAVKEILAAIEAGDAYYEAGARELLADGERAGLWSDTWEWDLADWDWSFVWACHAIVWAIGQYDAVKAGAR